MRRHSTNVAAQPVAGRSRLTSLAIGHLRPLLFSIGQAWRSPVSTFMTAAVIGIALALPFALYLLTVNLQGLAGRWDDSIQISVFLHRDIDVNRASQVAQQWRSWAAVAAVEVILPEQALAEYKRLSGFDAALQALGENPFPALLVVQPGKGYVDEAPLQSLIERLKAEPVADMVQLDTQWVRRLSALVDLAQRAGGWLAVLLGLGVLLVVGNTIRLHVEKRKDEIQITQLFGATDAFIQRPFVYSGLIYGVLGALLAAALLTAGQLWLHGAVERLALLYGSPFRLIGWNIKELTVLLMTGAGLGMGGSWLAVHRHIRALDD